MTFNNLSFISGKFVFCSEIWKVQCLSSKVSTFTHEAPYVADDKFQEDEKLLSDHWQCNALATSDETAHGIFKKRNKSINEHV